jgi:lipase maturation factor 1
MRWLLVRLMFGSGAIKLASGDATWRNLTALSYHYETQPLPTWVAWYANQLPEWFDRLACAAMFAIELGAPLLVFAPRRLRLAGAAALILLQTLIALTGNYGYFNVLAIALSVLLLDDAVVARWIPRPCHEWFDRRRTSRGRWCWPRWAPITVALALVPPSLVALGHSVGFAVTLPPPFSLAQEALQPFRVVNTYGLFAVMTTSRPEIIVEGSDDGVEWKAYEFKYKPGDVGRRPVFVAPHQPRLDWQMWFAALGRYEENPWFANFCGRLLEGSPDVLRLLAFDPFGGHPPRFVRAMLYQYRFADMATHRATGAWWTRERLGSYSPVLTLTHTP